MKVTVKIIGFASAFSGGDVQTLELAEGAAITQLLDNIQNREGNNANSILSMSVFLVNKVRADQSTILKDGDEVMIMFFLGGG